MDERDVFSLRLGHNDHRLLADVMAPRLGSRSAVSRLVGRVVVDAHTPRANPTLVETIQEIGLGLTIDPFTPALQYEGDGAKSFQALPYVRPDAVVPTDLQSMTAREQFVDEVVTHQLGVGATSVVAPYFYVATTDDPWWNVNLALVDATRTWMDHHRVRFQLIAPLAGGAVRLGTTSGIRDHISQFARHAVLANAASIWLMLSPLGKGDESYDKLLGVVEAIEAIRGHGLQVSVARAGRYGPALVAAGANGFDAGIGSGDSLNVTATARSRRRSGSGGGGSARVFIQSLGTSVERRHLDAVFHDQIGRGLLTCEQPTCCPDPDTMLREWRGHTVRTRASAVMDLLNIPAPGRLGFMADRLGAQLSTITHTNRLLAAARTDTQLHDRGPRELRNVLDHLDTQRNHRAAA